MKFQIVNLEKKYDKSGFSCGNAQLDEYFKKQAKQDVNRDLSACFVLIDDKNRVIGYYTLSANSISRDVFPDELAKRLPPSYSNIPTILLGRLAVDSIMKGKGFGELLLMDALSRSVSIAESLGTVAVVVDPIDPHAEVFYARYGFIKLPTSGKQFLPIKTIRDSMK